MSVPSAPQAPQATAGFGAGYLNQGTTKPQGQINGVAIVCWNAPASGDATSYAVTCSDSGIDAVTVTTAPWRAVFSGLTIGTQYTFDVVASNGDGDSDAATTNAVKPSLAPGWLSQVYYAWVAQFFYDGNTAETQFGGEFKAEHSAPERVVWQPERGTIEQTNFGVVDQFRTRSLGVSLACWSKGPTSDPPDQIHDDIANYDAAELLQNNVAASLNRIGFGGDVFRSEAWPPQNAANTALGAVVVLGLQLKFPMVDYVQSTATLAGIGQSGGVAPT